MLGYEQEIYTLFQQPRGTCRLERGAQQVEVLRRRHRHTINPERSLTIERPRVMRLEIPQPRKFQIFGKMIRYLLRQTSKVP